MVHKMGLETKTIISLQLGVVSNMRISPAFYRGLTINFIWENSSGDSWFFGLVGALEHQCLMTFHILGISSSQLTVDGLQSFSEGWLNHEPVFSYLTCPSSYVCWFMNLMNATVIVPGVNGGTTWLVSYGYGTGALAYFKDIRLWSILNFHTIKASASRFVSDMFWTCWMNIEPSSF